MSESILKWLIYLTNTLKYKTMIPKEENVLLFFLGRKLICATTQYSNRKTCWMKNKRRRKFEDPEGKEEII